MDSHPLIPYKGIKNLGFDQDIEIVLGSEHFQNVEFLDGKTTIFFETCFFRKVTIRNTEEINFPSISIAFFGCYIDEIEIKQISSENISVGFYGSIVKGSINSDGLKSVEISNCLLNGPLFIIKVENIRISYKKDNIDIPRWKTMFERLNGLNFRDVLKSQQKFFLGDAKYIDFGSDFENDGRRKSFDITLNITFSKEIIDIKTEIVNAFLKSLHISGSCQGKLSIENCSINNWYLYDFSPKEEVSFYNIVPERTKKDRKIGIHRCNLDNAWFDNVYFGQYNLISFYRTKFSKAIFTSCDFPESYKAFQNFMPIENVHYPENHNANYPKEQYEIFLQLKKSLESTGNYYESQKLQAISHEALKKIKNIPVSDQLILHLNFLSNNHGQSIKRPLFGFLICTMLFYILYLLSLGRIFNNNPIDWGLFGFYFSFIDITHRTDFLVTRENFNLGSQAIDYLNKIFMGFFIYQFVASFRKYGKK